MNAKIPTQTLIIFLSLNNDISLVRMGFLCCTDERVHEPGSQWRIMHIEHGKKNKIREKSDNDSTTMGFWCCLLAGEFQLSAEVILLS